MKQVKSSESLIYKQLDEVKESFAFLFCGHWLKGAHTQDRKNLGGLIETFLKAFMTLPEDNRPALVLKTSLGTFSEKSTYEILNRIDQIKTKVKQEMNFEGVLPSVYLVSGLMTDKEINEMYNHPKVKAMVSFTRGEGYGRPLAEFAAATEKPIIASNWSGHLDFLLPGNVALVNGKLDKIHQSAVWDNILIPESSWFTVDYMHGLNVLQRVFSQYDFFQRKSKTQHKHIVSNFSLSEMVERFKVIMERQLKNRPVEPKFIPLPGM